MTQPQNQTQNPTAGQRVAGAGGAAALTGAGATTAALVVPRPSFAGLSRKYRELLRLILAQADVRRRLEQMAITRARSATGAMTDSDWRDAEKIRTYAEKLSREIQSLQRLAANSANAYQARTLTQLTGKTVSPVARVDVSTVRGPDITPAGVYGRLANNYRYLISTGLDEATAIQQVIQRAETVAEADVMLAVRAQTTKNLTANTKVIGYRRVVHPEFAQSGASCGLCIVAATRFYKKAELMPIHDHCHCETVGIVDGADPGDEINKIDLNDVYERVGSKGARDLKRTRFQIRQHGELGPVLTYKGQNFRGPDLVSDDTEVDRETADRE